MTTEHCAVHTGQGMDAVLMATKVSRDDRWRLTTAEPGDHTGT